ncbi:integral membrane protein GPR155-like [Rhipicephalus sanguineus]|uniref:integral membrane protein GPR155-like n=1 Tax=Rhipicephalus sanguineus TaxID=34632 RepID=UPI0020C55180|nr:integral membrane protein GPR155-like [Rhipicephalus sanguineus]
MDVESPGPPPLPSTSSVAAPRKRSGHPSDADSEDTLIYSTASDESSDESDFVPTCYDEDFLLGNAASQANSGSSSSSSFASGKARLVKGREVRALDLLASHVCLSALLFLNLSQLRLHTLDWRLVGAVLLGKTALFAIVAAASVALSSFSRRRGRGRLGTAGLHAIFVTQVNDFGIAYPLVESVYGRSHTDFAGYLYLIAPLSLVLLNPIGFFMAELQGLRSQQRYTEAAVDATPQKPSVARGLFKAAAWAVLREVLSHPHVLFSLLAIAVNVGRCGTELPAPLAAILRLLGDAFAAPILFLLGYHIENAFREPDVRQHLFPALILSAVKSFVLPMFLKLSVELVLYWAGEQSGVKDRANFAFLYGTAPTAPIVILYASQRALPTATLATGVGVCTLLSLPVMYASGAVISDEGLTPAPAVSPHLQMRTVLASVSGLSFLASVLVIGLFILTGRTKSLICNVLLCLLICELFKGAGVLLWLLQSPHSLLSHVAVFLVTCSQYASRAWTASMALCVFLLKHYNAPELSTHARIMFFAAYGVPVILTATVMIVGRLVCGHRGNVDMEVPLFFNGECEAVASVVLLSVCAGLIALCLLQHAYERALKSSTFFECCCCCRSKRGFEAELEYQRYEKAPPAHKSDAIRDTKRLLETTARVRFNLSPSGQVSWPGSDDSASIKTYEPEDDVRGITLLIGALFISILIGIFVSYGRLFLGIPYGVFRALQLVDATLSFGQGMLVFLACGLEGKLLSEAKARALLLLRVAGKPRRPKQRTVLSVGLLNANEIVCRQFNVYHRRAFEEFLDETEVGFPVSPVRSGFHGHRLVDWLLDAGLVKSRDEGVVYGRRLLDGGLLVHGERAMHFYDGPYDYLFVC